MKIDYDSLAKISKEAALYTARKTSNILDGSFSSLYRGKSLEFDDLKEYAPGDDVTDIDWKSSSRADKLLIRRFVAEKKHNVLFVCDTGPKLDADTPLGESKTELALLTLGICGYLLGRQGADIALAYAAPAGIRTTDFRSGEPFLEGLLHEYGESIHAPSSLPIAELLGRLATQLPRRMILVVLTDLGGIAGMDETLFQYLTARNDLLLFSMDDAFLTGESVYDTASGGYVDRIFARSKELRKEEIAMRTALYTRARTYAKRTHAGLAILQRAEEVPDKVVELFARQREGMQRAVFG